MPTFEFDAKKTILPAIIGVVLLVIGVVVSNITWTIGKYVTTTLKSSINMTNVPDLVPESAAQIVGPVITLLGVALLATAIGLMIYSLIAGVTKSTAEVAS